MRGGGTFLVNPIISSAKSAGTRLHNMYKFKIYVILNISIVPIVPDVPFPKTFVTLCRKILARLFRVFVHVYIHHFDRIVAIGAVSKIYF